MGSNGQSLPAAADSRQPCEDAATGAVIYWWNPRRQEPDYEEFDTLDLALADLETYKRDYPWNTYYVANVVLVHEATERYVDRPQMSGCETITSVVSVQGLPDGKPPQAEQEMPNGN